MKILKIIDILVDQLGFAFQGDPKDVLDNF